MNDVGTRGSTAGIAEPLLANVAHDNRRGVADPAVAATVGRQLFRRDTIIVIFFSKVQIVDTRSYCVDLTVRNRLGFQLFKAIELK